MVVATLPKGAKTLDMPASIPHLERGDEVYFQHASGPMSGKVVCWGAHGCTLDAGGQHHQVTYDRLLGHKVRVEPKIKVVDDGEDGFVGEDETGRRRYFHDPLTADGEAEEPMRKSLMPRLLLFTPSSELLLKGAVANRPGLGLQDVTDKRGIRTKRWKRLNVELPKTRARGDRTEGGAPAEKLGAHNAKKGDGVSFKLGDLEGHGEITGTPGAQGAHVKDASGHVHKVLWSQMTGRKAPSGPKPAASGGGKSGSGGEGSGGGADIASELKDRPPFPQAEVDALPRKASQPVSTWEELQAKGEEGLGEFKGKLDEVAKALNLKTGFLPEDLTGEHLDSRDGFLLIGPLKTEKRAREKVTADYRGDWTQLRDMVRATIAVDSMADLRTAVRAVEETGLRLAQKPNDRFTNPTREGYRDLMTIVRLPNGMLAELQYHVKAMIGAKAAAHAHYEEQRTVVGKNKLHPDYDPNSADPDGPQPHWSKEDKAKFDEHVGAQSKLFSAAWDRAQKRK